MKHKIIAYLLILFAISACHPQATSIPPQVTSTPVEEGEVHPGLQNIPVYPDVKGWELFNEGETPKIGKRKGFVLLFSKEGTVAQLEIIQGTTAS